MKPAKPYREYPFILSGLEEIADFLRCGRDQVQGYIDKGAPIVHIGGRYSADKLALRLWLRVGH